MESVGGGLRRIWGPGLHWNWNGGIEGLIKGMELRLLAPLVFPSEADSAGRDFSSIALDAASRPTRDAFIFVSEAGPRLAYL